MIDVEALVATWIEANVDDTRGMTETPANLDTLLPVAKVMKIGGSYDGFRITRATVDVDFFDSTRDRAWSGALHVQWCLHNLFVRRRQGDAVVARVETLTDPRRLPYDNTNLRRVGATYRITVHPA
ncbi:hypothetical protein [Sphaerisporangium sp. TRM90804]|uniref:hypothetical protein n=1 Tax=Sphaerisporangium sp. TRM90804 TaxID=3031113 RepID=UPI0024488DC7|nr:hypothetical protein [Sphaerisporangium sp. TRM90804]MDH2424736.1 hypothetical protein [Sphaerisporangium sp. TRM90804]